MEAILGWVNLAAAALLAVGCLMLFVDGRGQRKALSAAQATLAALQRQTAAHDLAIGSLSRSIATLDPLGIKPTTTVQRPTDQALAARHETAHTGRRAIDAAMAAVEAGEAPVGLSRPFVPSPKDVALARAATKTGATAERIEKLHLPAVDMTGDRTARHTSIPASPVPPSIDRAGSALDEALAVIEAGEEPANIRARIEAQERARHPDDPPAPASDEDDEPTLYQQRRPPRPTLLGPLGARSGPLATLGPEVESTTLVSAGVVRLEPAELARVDAYAKAQRLSREEAARELARIALNPANDRETPSPTPAMGLDPKVERRYAEKVAEAHAAGVDVAHCGSKLCQSGAHRIAGCACDCPPCARLAGLLADAVREVLRRGRS